jgi:hypothetical protein
MTLTEFLIILLGIMFLLIFSSPLPESSKHRQISNNYFLAAWLGGEPLKSVFWPFFLLLNLTLTLADNLVKFGDLTVSSWDDIHFMLILPIIWWIVGIWQCSANTTNKIWAGLARMATLAVIIEYVLKLYIRVYLPRIFFNCEDIMLNYGSCF